MNFKALPIGLLALSLLMPLRAAAALHLQFGIEPNYSLAFVNPAKSYYKELNEDFRTGRYTFTTPIPQWENIETPNFHEFGGEGSCLVKLRPGKIKKPRAGIVLGYRGSSPRTTYDKSYDVWDDYSKVFVPANFKRQEGINTSTIFLGGRGKANLIDKLDVSTTLGINFYRVKGNIDYTMDRLDNPYEQYRKADYKGSGTGFLIEAGADYKIIKNILFGVSFGYRTGKVQTKGKEVKSWPDTTATVTKDYSPEFNFNSTYGRFYIGMSF